MADDLSEKRKPIYDEAKGSIKDFCKGKFKSAQGESFLRLIGFEEEDDIKECMKTIKQKDNWAPDELLKLLLTFLKDQDSSETDAELKEVFQAFDEDGSGQISIDELVSAMAKLGQECGDEEIVEMVTALEDGEGESAERNGMEVTFKGFKKLMAE